MTVSIIPWPNYHDDGRGPFFLIRIEDEKVSRTVTWNHRRQRFVGGSDLKAVKRYPGVYLDVCMSISKMVGRKIPQQTIAERYFDE